MCRAIPHKLLEIDGNKGFAEVGGVRQWVDLTLVQDPDRPNDESDPKIGDYVLVHAGFAIQVLDKEAALETLEIIRELVAIEQETP